VSIYKINYDIVNERILPPSKRNEKILAFLRALTKPLQDLNDDFNDVTIPDIRDKLKRNSQIIVLNDTLNRVFGVTSAPFIFIQDTFNLEEFDNLFNNNEGVPDVHSFNESELPADEPLFLFNEPEFFGAQDFIVFVPAALFPTIEAQVRAETKKYVLTGITFDVQSY